MGSNSLKAAFLAFLLAAAADTSRAFDCDEGCNMAWKPVCSVDGQTFTNKCLAVCQDIEVAHKGRCADDPAQEGVSDTVAPTALKQTAKVTKADMARFADEGFSLQSVQVMATLPAGSVANDFLPTAKGPVDPLTPAELKKIHAVRITPDGFLYVTKPGAHTAATAGLLEALATKGVPPSANATDSESPSARRLRGGGPEELQDNEPGEHDRKLTIFGTDNRFWVSGTTTYPYSAIGQLVSNTGRCSGAVVSTNAILTAGHCIFYAKVWSSGFAFTPGRSGTAAPFGTWSSWAHATTFSGWTSTSFSDAQPGNWNWDMAVINFRPNSGVNLGSRVGTLGYTTACPAPAVTTTGYPGDLFGGNWMYAQPTCPTYTRGCTTSSTTYYVAQSSCDIYPGQSGSPVYSSSKRLIYSVVSHQSSSYNGFVNMEPVKFASIKSWASRTA